MGIELFGREKGLIILEDVCKIYDKGEQVCALEHIDLTIKDGEYLSVVGASGSGKTTLMHILGCLDRQTSGRYLFDGAAVEQMTADELTALRGRKIGFVFQSFQLIRSMTALENTALPLLFQGVPRREREARAAEVLKRVGLGHRLTHTPDQMSGGQQQRAAIARAIITRPSMLLADEPTGNLDPQSTQEIMGLFDELHRAGHTIVLITHDQAAAKRAERSIRIENGRIEK